MSATSPFPIGEARTIEELLKKIQQYFDELYQERIGGALVGDVFGVGDDEILTLAIGLGLQKLSSTLSVKINAADAITSTASGLGISDATTLKHGALPILSGSSAEVFSGAGTWIAKGGTMKAQAFTASGNFIVPAGVTEVYVTLAAGGGGGGGATGANDLAGGGGGGAGDCIIKKEYTVTPAAVLTVTIGAGGAASSDGNDSSFDALTVLGGKKGITSASGKPGDGGQSGGNGSGNGSPGVIGLPTISGPGGGGMGGVSPIGFGSGGNGNGSNAPSAGKNGYCLVEWNE